MESIGKVMDSLSTKYKNLILIGEFNATEFDTSAENLYDIYNFKNLINLHNPKCTDLMMTNRSRSFQNSCVIETRLSDFHKMTVTVLRSSLPKLGPQIIKYRDYKNFSDYNFWLQINKEREKWQNTLELDFF